MTRKGGGRDGRGRVRVPVSELKLPDAAANPVKAGGRESGRIPPEGESRTVSPPTGRPASAADPAAVTYCEECGHPSNDGERIRELEAAGDDLFAECKKQLIRAERAEARMKELETLIKGKFTTLGELLHARDERSLSAQRE